MNNENNVDNNVENDINTNPENDSIDSEFINIEKKGSKSYIVIVSILYLLVIVLSIFFIKGLIDQKNKIEKANNSNIEQVKVPEDENTNIEEDQVNEPQDENNDIDEESKDINHDNNQNSSDDQPNSFEDLFNDLNSENNI